MEKQEKGTQVPDHVIESWGRGVLAGGGAGCETEEGQLAFREWAENTEKEGR